MLHLAHLNATLCLELVNTGLGLPALYAQLEVGLLPFGLQFEVRFLPLKIQLDGTNLGVNL